MKGYQKRHIEFNEIYEVDGWKIKIYTISKDDEFKYPEFYAKVKAQVKNWLQIENGFNAQHDYMGFLILHAGTEGIFTLINWWVGKNMLNTLIFKSDYDNLFEFEKISGNGLAPCIWELEIINHERIAWTNHTLKTYPKPNYSAYLKSTFSGDF